MTSRRWRIPIVACVLVLCTLAIGRAQDPSPAQKPPALRGFSDSRTGDELDLEQRFQKIPDSGHAEADLRKLTTEPHAAGTDATKRVAEWLRDRLREDGFEAQIVTYSAYLPLPREVKLEMLAPQPMPLAAAEPDVPLDHNDGSDHILPAASDYSASGDVTAPAIYANYATPEDFHTLDSLGVSVKGRIVLARYGRGYRGVKAKLAEDRGALGIIFYDDPEDDGFAAGDVFPDGPWRPLDAVQRGSILYTQIRPGDPLDGGAPGTKRLAVADAPSLPRIPAIAISARDASVILAHLGRARVPTGWQGSLPITYHVGPGDAKLHLKVDMDYEQRPIYNVIAKMSGTNDDQWVVLGNHHDAWVYGAADPGSGTSAMLEVARGLGELVRTGWRPRRTIVICEWDAEEPGLVGSTDWVEANRAQLQAKAIAYINTDVGVTGPNFSGSAVPSLKEFLRDATRSVNDPQSGQSIYAAWRNRVGLANDDVNQEGRSEIRRPTISALGAGSDFSPFLDYAGIPSIDLSFTGDYGVYHSRYDDFYWMQHFGDPDFAYETALARVMGVMALRLDEADVLPFDYETYASEIATAEDNLASRAAALAGAPGILKRVTDASSEFSDAATHAQVALSHLPADSANNAAINRDLAGVEEALLAPEGLSGRAWFKHTVFAPGTNTGYTAETLPGVAEALDHRDLAELQREADSLASALRRAAARLNDAATLARPAVPPGADVGH
jgi:N-acetylated-alpha-linked acidic dipeptidase